jgi:hypothetical protein
MSCKLHVADAVKQDILDCDPEAIQQIGGFLLALQENPLPKNRSEMDRGAFYCRLRCGYYVAWEVSGDLMRLVSTGDTRGISIRILGVGRGLPGSKR